MVCRQAWSSPMAGRMVHGIVWSLILATMGSIPGWAAISLEEFRQKRPGFAQMAIDQRSAFIASCEGETAAEILEFLVGVITEEADESVLYGAIRVAVLNAAGFDADGRKRLIFSLCARYPLAGKEIQESIVLSLGQRLHPDDSSPEALGILLTHLRQKDAKGRPEAVEALAGFRDSTTALDSLLQTLQDADPLVRQAAVRRVSEVKKLPPDKIRGAIRPLLGDSSWRVRGAVLQALRTVPDAADDAMILEFRLEQEANRSLRGQIIRLMAEVRRAEASRTGVGQSEGARDLFGLIASDVAAFRSTDLEPPAGAAAQMDGPVNENLDYFNELVTALDILQDPRARPLLEGMWQKIEPRFVALRGSIETALTRIPGPSSGDSPPPPAVTAATATAAIASPASDAARIAAPPQEQRPDPASAAGTLTRPPGLNPNGAIPPDVVQKLFQAVKTGDLPAIRRLAEKGIKPNLFNDKGMTPLMAAAFYGQADVLRLLIDLHASVGECNPTNGLTPLMVATAARQGTVVKLLVRAGADLHARDLKGRTALGWAREKRFPDLVSLLTSLGARQ